MTADWPLAWTALGLDIGRVIIDPRDPGGAPDTGFLAGDHDGAMAVQPADGAIEVTSDLVRRAAGRVWLVSKAGPRIERRTRDWLEHHAFCARTGLDPTHLRFCRERADKRGICEALAIDAFVDDRADVLAAMAGAVAHRLLYGPDAAAHADPALVCVRDWRDVRAALLGPR